ncbi:Gfo/Idh/MocA family oxidoreductase [Candidatus Woesearchaeota archaeon]|nr:Gfo/Idh/MocA family oxidoreductase [Candidatus Woesearchaeota archaeon]
MTRVAVIGVGSMGQNHARVYFNSDEAELVAVSDANEQQAERIGKKYNVPFYKDYKKMLEMEEIEAVSIAVPTSLHKEVALFNMYKRKHILLEKPIAASEEEAREIIDAAEKNKVRLMVGHIERFNPAILELKKRWPELGEIYKIEVQRIGPFPGRMTDVGVIIDLSVHDIDIINYLTNMYPTKVFAETQQKLHPHHEDSVTALLRYGKDIKALLSINYLSPTKIRQLKVFGEKGMFETNYLTQELFFYENPGYTSDSWDTVIEGDMRKIIIQKKEPLQAEIEAFLSCVKEGHDAPVNGQQGLDVLRIANYLISSAKENKMVELSWQRKN